MLLRVGFDFKLNPNKTQFKVDKLRLKFNLKNNFILNLVWVNLNLNVQIKLNSVWFIKTGWIQLAQSELKRLGSNPTSSLVHCIDQNKETNSIQ